MKNFFLFAIAALFMSSCQSDDTADSSFSMKAAGADYSGYPVTVQTVSGDVTTNTTWTNDRVWEISGVIRVKSGATLTIQPGTFIKGKPLAAGVATGVLVITKTGKINAQGTATAPIIFTSYKLLDGNAATTGYPGDFGGVVILGDAEVNTWVTTNVVEGLGDQPNVNDFYYGGTNNTHNAGALNYARIEFAGRILDLGVEINGLTLAGVGSGTVLHHIQVSYARDDSFQFFGGTVNASHLVSFAPYDDNFDFDLGYTGTITKAIALADSNSLHSFAGSGVGSPDSNGIELDNNASGTTTLLITRPVISEMSIIGVSSTTVADLYENAIHVRRLGQIRFTDVTVTGYNRGVYWESPSLQSASFWAGISIHGFDTPILPAGTFIGLGNTASTVNPAPKWGLTQPFFNDGALDLSGNTGAFKTEANWTNTWTKFNNF
ncbi:hypothetical protein [uncultured Flavobacterium sp.]|uniref:hypothetical protein n=1 Tax=uncultured Flavobacterium sp. TaxID=165435 RepID=UPI0030813E13